MGFPTPCTCKCVVVGGPAEGCHPAHHQQPRHAGLPHQSHAQQRHAVDQVVPAPAQLLVTSSALRHTSPVRHLEGLPLLLRDPLLGDVQHVRPVRPERHGGRPREAGQPRDPGTRHHPGQLQLVQLLERRRREGRCWDTGTGGAGWARRPQVLVVGGEEALAEARVSLVRTVTVRLTCLPQDHTLSTPSAQDIQTLLTRTALQHGNMHRFACTFNTSNIDTYHRTLQSQFIVFQTQDPNIALTEHCTAPV